MIIDISAISQGKVSAFMICGNENLASYKQAPLLNKIRARKKSSKDMF